MRLARRQGATEPSSASVALRRLEQRAGCNCRPCLPAKGSRPRTHDDGQLAAFAQTTAGGAIPGLRMHLIPDEPDPAHRIWNRLIAREHPLGRRPLVGAQLRYLIECDQGILGAVGLWPPGVSPGVPGSMDWLGFAGPAAELGQSHRVVSFFAPARIARAELGFPVLRSGVAAGGRDWPARYGRQPVLVETYVDRVRHHGRSLAAANWRRLGQSKGRGRDDRGRQHGQSPKDVWVYELSRKARGQLQTTPVEPVAPRSVFAPALKETGRRRKWREWIWGMRGSTRGPCAC